jgi:hypothetical protein
MAGQVQCVSKTRFFSEQSAQLRADDINFEYGYEKVFVYKCNNCLDFHLTRQRPGDK